MCVRCSFLFVTGFTKLYFNKLLELLSCILLCDTFINEKHRRLSCPQRDFSHVPAVTGKMKA